MLAPCRQTEPDTTWYSRNCKGERKVEELDRGTVDFVFWNLRAVDFFSCKITEASPVTQSPSLHFPTRFPFTGGS